MSRTYSAQDVYLDGDLAYTDAQVLDFPERKLLRVKAKADRGPWLVVVELTDPTTVEIAPGDTGDVRSWTGTTPDQRRITVAAIQRRRRCCGRR